MCSCLISCWNCFVWFLFDPILQVFRSAIRSEEVQVPAWEHFWFRRSERNIPIEWCLRSQFFLHQKSLTQLSNPTMQHSRCTSWSKMPMNVWFSTTKHSTTSVSEHWNSAIQVVSSFFHQFVYDSSFYFIILLYSRWSQPLDLCNNERRNLLFEVSRPTELRPPEASS